MAKITLKSDSRVTKVPRWVIRDAITGVLTGASNTVHYVSNTAGFHTLGQWSVKKSAKKSAKKAIKKATKKIAKKGVKKSTTSGHKKNVTQRSPYNIYLKKAAKKKSSKK